MTLRKFLKQWGAETWGAAVAPIFFSLIAAESALNAVPRAPLPRRVREILPKAGVSRVYYGTIYFIIAQMQIVQQNF